MRRLLFGSISEILRRRHYAANRDHIFRRGAPGDGRLHVACIDCHRFVESCAFIAVERFPIAERRVPRFSFRSHRAALEIAEHRLIRRDQARARARFNAHIAHGQPFLDAHRLERVAAIFDDIACAACRSDHSDDVEDEVFRCNPCAKRSGNAHFHRT